MLINSCMPHIPSPTTLLKTKPIKHIPHAVTAVTFATNNFFRSISQPNSKRHNSDIPKPYKAVKFLQLLKENYNLSRRELNWIVLRNRGAIPCEGLAQFHLSIREISAALKRPLLCTKYPTTQYIQKHRVSVLSHLSTKRYALDHRNLFLKEKQKVERQYSRDYLSNTIDQHTRDFTGNLEAHRPVFLIDNFLTFRSRADYPIYSLPQFGRITYVYAGPNNRIFSPEARQAILDGDYILTRNLYLENRDKKIKDVAYHSIDAILAIKKSVLSLSRVEETRKLFNVNSEELNPENIFKVALIYEKVINAAFGGIRSDDPYSDTEVYQYSNNGKEIIESIGDLYSMRYSAKDQIIRGNFTIVPPYGWNSTRLSKDKLKERMAVVVGTNHYISVQNMWGLLKMDIGY